MATTKKLLQKKNIYLLSVGITAAFMLVVWIATEAITGKNSLIIIDGLHQYMPYFADYHEKLRSGGSLFYSFHEGLGTNFFCLWTYYLSSPLNLLIILVPKSFLNTMVSLIVTLKILICAFTFSVFLLNRPCYKTWNLSAVPLSVAYAISSYVIGYYWNVMWMDCIMIFPLIILGYDFLAEKQDARLYILSLFYALFTNYYIGFIICIFLVLWAIVYPYRDWKQTLKSAGIFAGSSLLAGGLSAVVLLPAYIGISSTASAKRVFPAFTEYGSYLNQIQRLFVGTEPINNQVDDSGLNIYCGCFVIALFFVFLFSGKFGVVEKVRYMLYLAILMVSYNTRLLNYIWHGLHDQYGIPNRFSFLSIFLLLLISYEVLQKFDEIRGSVFLFAASFGTILCTVCGLFADKKLPKLCYIITIVLIIAYMLVAYFGTVYPKKKQAFKYAFVAVMMVEVLAAGGYNWGQNGVIEIGYYFSETDVMEDVKENLATKDPGFYRVELANSKMLDEATWHGLNCVTMFGSTARGDMVKAMGRLGFYTGANEYLFCGETPLTSALTSTKYVMLRKDDFNNFHYDFNMNLGDCYVYRNPDWLPVGICMNEEIADYSPQYTFFAVQNAFAERATGVSNPLFTEEVYEWDATGTNCTVDIHRNIISYTPNADSPKVQATMTAPHEMDLYADISGGNVRQVRLYIDGQMTAYDRYQTQAFHIGHLLEGQEVMLEFEFNADGGDTDITLHTADFHKDAWEKVYAELSKNTFDPDEYRSGYMHGTVNVGEGQMLFLSIPDDDGWSIYVDGVKTETTPILSAFMGIKLSPGQHEIEMKYVSPGFKEGLLITIGSLLVFVPILFFTAKAVKKKAKKADSDEGESDADNDSEEESETVNSEGENASSERDK